MLTVVRSAVVLGLVAVVGCVNNYVVRDPDDDGDTTADCPMDTCGKGDAAGDDGSGAFTCEPCENDVECGDQWDNCVSLDELGLHCLTACPEAGCAEGHDCRNTLSADGVQAMQCVPHMPMCGGTTED
jgi:hypothetical protein